MAGYVKRKLVGRALGSNCAGMGSYPSSPPGRSADPDPVPRWLEKQQQPLRIVDYYKIYLGQFLPSVAARPARMLMDLATTPLQSTLSMEIDGAPLPFPDWAYWHFLFMAARAEGESGHRDRAGTAGWDAAPRVRAALTGRRAAAIPVWCDTLIYFVREGIAECQARDRPVQHVDMPDVDVRTLRPDDPHQARADPEVHARLRGQLRRRLREGGDRNG